MCEEFDRVEETVALLASGRPLSLSFRSDEYLRLNAHMVRSRSRKLMPLIDRMVERLFQVSFSQMSFLSRFFEEFNCSPRERLILRKIQLTCSHTCASRPEVSPFEIMWFMYITRFGATSVSLHCQ